MQKENKGPFFENIKYRQDHFGMDFKTACDSVQSDYEQFVAHIQKLVERQDSWTNRAYIQIISHFALLATLVMTISGIFISQTTQKLSLGQSWLILIVICFEIISLSFGAWDYIQTILFHKKWAKTYQSIAREADRKVESGTIQFVSELRKIEEKYIEKSKDKPKETTDIKITYAMVAFCLFGSLLLVFLFYTYFFDVPFIK